MLVIGSHLELSLISLGGLVGDAELLREQVSLRMSAWQSTVSSAGHQMQGTTIGTVGSRARY